MSIPIEWAAMFSTPADDSGEWQRNRRRFLRFLLGSPLLASTPVSGWQAVTGSGAIADPKDALNVMDFEPAARKVRTERLVAHLGIKLDLNLYPYQMSGGQQQLVSIMRALVVEPEILFLDEPFSALDYEMTLFMRDQLQRIFVETGTTTVLVSHDLEEAVYLADRILLLSRRPACIADYVHYDAARPRTDATLSQHDFVRIKAHCLDVFQREVRKG